jgi:hypothetical protein
VLNDTWVVNPSTVVTVRGGWNEFKDNNELPEPFDATTLWPGNTAFTSQFTDANRFPTTTLTGYRGTGWSNRSNNTYYQYGANGSVSKLKGTHSVKAATTILGLKSFSWRLDRHLHVRRPIHGQRACRHAPRLRGRGHSDLHPLDETSATPPDSCRTMARERNSRSTGLASNTKRISRRRKNRIDDRDEPLSLSTAW